MMKVSDNATSNVNENGMNFIDMDKKLRKRQLSLSHVDEDDAISSGDGYDEGQDLHRQVFAQSSRRGRDSDAGESHLTPEEISIRFYERNVLANLQQQEQQHEQQQFYADDDDDDENDEGQAAYNHNENDDPEQHHQEGENLRTSPHDYYEDGTLKPIHERLWEKHHQKSTEKVEQVTTATNIHAERELHKTLKQGYIFDKKKLPTELSVRSNQEKFDEILEKAIVLFSHPTADSVSTTNIATFIRRVEPDFNPQKYGAPELLFLLRNSNYLMSWKGKWAFVRQFDAERDDVTVKLEKYKWREAPSFDGIRTVPRNYDSRNIQFS